MAFCRNLNTRLGLLPFRRSNPLRTSPVTATSSLTILTRSLSGRSVEENSELFDYTTGRWIWNDAPKHSERRRVFNVPEFKRLAAAAVNLDADDVSRFEKLAEGGFNRTFLVTMRDGFRFVGRIPYPVTEPKHLVVASEVATMDFLRSHGMPVPEIYSYSATSNNAAGTEYIFMELVHGTNLGDIWFDLPRKAIVTVVTKLVELESRLFALPFPASGSLYYTKDLRGVSNKVNMPTQDSASDSRFCIGPDTRLSMWNGERLNIQTDRGPYLDPVAALRAGAKKEIAYLTKHGKLLHPYQRLRRETYDFQKQSPLEQVENLERYLQIVPYLVPNGNGSLTSPTLRHPDLQPNNIFISDDLEITGLIDWQHSFILPLFLQCGIPNSLQNYGDSVSESLEPPQLPDNLNELSDSEQFEQVMLARRRQLHYSYVAMTEKLNPTHYDALAHDFSILRRKIFDHASSPWEGDNVTLKSDLIHLTKSWSKLIKSNSNTSDNAIPSCPITFTEHEVDECLRLNGEQVEADEQLQACRDVIGVGPEGWVPVDQYDEIKQRGMKLKAAALKAAESEEERARLNEHWVFDDFDEDEYA